jgi:hypothetical protein
MTASSNRVAAGMLLTACAQLLWNRTRFDDAIGLAEQAHGQYDHPSALEEVLGITIWLGGREMDQLHLQRSEAVLRCVAVAAHLAGCELAARRARAVLMRTLWWLGCIDLARQLCVACETHPPPVTPETEGRAYGGYTSVAVSVVEHALAVRVAVSEQRFECAAAHARNATVLPTKHLFGHAGP